MKANFQKFSILSIRTKEAICARLHADEACRRVFIFYSARKRWMVDRQLPQRSTRSRPDLTVVAVGQAAPRTPSKRGIHRKTGEGFDSHHPTFQHLTQGEIHECSNACSYQTEN